MRMVRKNFGYVIRSPSHFKSTARRAQVPLPPGPIGSWEHKWRCRVQKLNTALKKSMRTHRPTVPLCPPLIAGRKIPLAKESGKGYNKPTVQPMTVAVLSGMSLVQGRGVLVTPCGLPLFVFHPHCNPSKSELQAFSSIFSNKPVGAPNIWKIGAFCLQASCTRRSVKRPGGFGSGLRVFCSGIPYKSRLGTQGRNQQKRSY